MRRRNRFWVGFVSAALTFGALTAFLGPRHFHGRPGGFYGDSRWEMQDHPGCHHDCCHEGQTGSRQDTSTTGH